MEVPVPAVVEATAVPVPDVPEVVPPVAAIPPAVVVPPSPLSLADDALVTVTVDGEERTIPWKEARSNISGGLKFTKNMQQVAAERRDLEGKQAHLAQLEADKAALVSFMQNGEQMAQLVAARYPQFVAKLQQPAAAVDPNEIATVGQAQAIADRNMVAFKQLITETQQAAEQKVAEATQKINVERETQAHAGVIKSTLAEIFTTNPVLNVIPDAEDIIRYNVYKMQPKTEAEALTAFRQVAAGIVEGINKHTQETKKVTVVAAAKQKLVTHSIEPAVGSAPKMAPVNFKAADGSVDWKKITQAARDYAAS